MGIKLNKIVTCVDCARAMVDMSDGLAHVSCASDEAAHRALFGAEGKNCAGNCGGFKHLSKQAGGKIQLKDGLRYMLAGKSEFTMLSLKTGERFRYKLTKKEAREKKADGSSDYIYYLNSFDGGEFKYAGVIFYDGVNNIFKFGKGAKGMLSPTHINIRSLLFVMNKLNNGLDVDTLELYHAGKCGRCGRKLTTPESILTGLGPECSDKCGVPRVKII